MKAARSYRWSAWIALSMAVAGIIFLRAPEMVLAPALLFDEGAKVFSYFYEHRGPSSYCVSNQATFP